MSSFSDAGGKICRLMDKPQQKKPALSDGLFLKKRILNSVKIFGDHAHQAGKLIGEASFIVIPDKQLHHRSVQNLR